MTVLAHTSPEEFEHFQQTRFKAAVALGAIHGGVKWNTDYNKQLALDAQLARTRAAAHEHIVVEPHGSGSTTELLTSIPDKTKFRQN